MLRIISVTHKEYPIPCDPLYIPVMAGSALLGSVPASYVRDDFDGGISERNPAWSELTGLYMMWKRSDEICPDADMLGMCHYRRYFAVRRASKKIILTGDDAKRIIKPGDVILPKKRRYIIETNHSQYVHAHHRQDLAVTRDVLCELQPEYTDAYDRRMQMRSGHRFNMFIMPKELLGRYCEWLFGILFEVEKRLDTSGYEGRDRRVLGLIAERLLDVWIDRNGIGYTEMPFIMTEGESLLQKGAGLIYRKFKGLGRGDRK